LTSAFDWEVLTVAYLTALPCAILGSFLFLSKRTMQVESISHAVLLGVVCTFLLGLSSSLLLFFMSACLAALFAVHGSAVVEYLLKYYKTTSSPLVFPVLFALAVYLLNSRLRNSHFDTHTVLLGELAMVGFERIERKGIDFGPQAAWNGLAALVVSLFLIAKFSRQLSQSIFDPVLAHVMGAPVRLIQTVFLGAVCFAAVAAIEIVGTVLTLGLFALPPAAARLVTKHVWSLVLVSCFFALSGVTLGYLVGLWMDVSLAGSITLALGIPFFLALVLPPAKNPTLLRPTKSSAVLGRQIPAQSNTADQSAPVCNSPSV
jgi:manganese/zinc/iron transport system permease protein